MSCFYARMVERGLTLVGDSYFRTHTLISHLQKRCTCPFIGHIQQNLHTKPTQHLHTKSVHYLHTKSTTKH
jgi:hypothetical protein